MADKIEAEIPEPTPPEWNALINATQAVLLAQAPVFEAKQLLVKAEERLFEAIAPSFQDYYTRQVEGDQEVLRYVLQGTEYTLRIDHSKRTASVETRELLIADRRV